MKGGTSFAVMRLNQGVGSLQDVLTEIPILFMCSIVMIFSNGNKTRKFDFAVDGNDRNQSEVKTFIRSNNFWITPAHQFA